MEKQNILTTTEPRKRDLENQFYLVAAGLTFISMGLLSYYRFSNGEFTNSIIDLVVACLAVFVFVQAWQFKQIPYLNLFAIITSMVGTSIVIHLRGLEALFYAFPVMGAAFFMLKSKTSLVLNFFYISAVSIFCFHELTTSQIASAYPSLVLSYIFSLFFSLRSDNQNTMLMKLVTEDTLTGAKNRRSFDDMVEAVLTRKKRNQNPVSMLLLDLDLFKKINDTYGHKQGDQILIDFTQTVEAMIRTNDSMYRIGGEEFVVIANNCSLENARELAETIRELVIQCPELSKFKVTVSIGVAEVLEKDTGDSWFRRADQALYASKASGRNKVSIAKLYKSNIKNKSASTSDLDANPLVEKQKAHVSLDY